MRTEAFKIIRFMGLFKIINKYPENMKPDMRCCHPIGKHPDYCLRADGFYYLIFEL